MNKSEDGAPLWVRMTAAFFGAAGDDDQQHAAVRLAVAGMAGVLLTVFLVWAATR